MPVRPLPSLPQHPESTASKNGVTADDQETWATEYP
jgi:hypothetical protein